MNAKQKNEPLNLEPIDDSLSIELLVAGAIAEQIELHHQMHGSSSPDGSTPRPQIDPRFQEDYNNL
jgi:hypothetical protein